jgi:hypothetical protein
MLHPDEPSRLLEILEDIRSALLKRPQELPASVDLWDTSIIASYLKRSPDHVRKEITPLPSFPKPIRLPVAGRSQALYKAREVIKWAEGLQER